MGRPAVSGERYLTQLNFQVVKLLCLRGLTKENSLKLGEEIICMIRHKFGGEVIYIPSVNPNNEKTRNTQIVEDFNSGATLFDLADKYQLTSRRIRGIVDAAKKSGEKEAKD